MKRLVDRAAKKAHCCRTMRKSDVGPGGSRERMLAWRPLGLNGYLSAKTQANFFPADLARMKKHQFSTAEVTREEDIDEVLYGSNKEKRKNGRAT